ncbi:hypothetical protein D3C85_1879030 [compost metagenome]
MGSPGWSRLQAAPGMEKDGAGVSAVRAWLGAHLPGARMKMIDQPINIGNWPLVNFLMMGRPLACLANEFDLHRPRHGL